MTTRPTSQQVERAVVRSLSMQTRAYLSALAEAFVLATEQEDESRLDSLLFDAGERLGLDAQDFTDLAAKKWGMKL